MWFNWPPRITRMQPATFQHHFLPSAVVYLAINIFLLSSIKSLLGITCPVNRGFEPYSVELRSLPILTNKQLVNHQIHQVNNVSSIWRCATLCLVRRHCMSFNYDRTSGVCQLNDADADVYPCHLVDSDHFGYYQIGLEFQQVRTIQLFRIYTDLLVMIYTLSNFTIRCDVICGKWHASLQVTLKCMFCHNSIYYKRILW